MDIIKLKQGAFFAKSITVGIDLTGATIDAQFRNTIESADATDLTTAIADAENGIMTISATSAETATWDVGIYLCDVRIDIGGVVQFTETFKIVVERSVTRD